MKKIEEYVNSIYRNVDGNKEELNELKQEMRSHLLEAVHELKEQGKSEEEAVRIAIENFGGKQQIRKGLSEFFNMQKRFARCVLGFVLVSLVLGIFFLSSAFLEAKEYKETVKEFKAVEQEKEIIMNDVFSILGDSSELSGGEEGQLLKVFEKYQEKLNLLAVFSATELEDWLQNNEVVKEGPDSHFPIDYPNATIVIGNEGVIENTEQIVPSGYDLGTVVMANEQWIVQYEYKSSYENVVERHHQLTYYGPQNLYQLPILFFVVFGVLGVIWLFLKSHNRKLKGVMS